MRPIPLAAGQPEHERIECRECGQLLAKRWPGGGLLVVVINQHVDREGRIVIQCPSCNTRTRLRPHRYRAA